MSSVAEIRAASEITVTCQSGRVYRLVRPCPEDFVIAGASTLPFLAQVEFQKGMEHAEIAAEVARKVVTPEDVAALLDMQDRVLARVMIEPRYFAGHVADCPEDRVCRGHIGNDFNEINAALGRTADGGSGGEAALAAQRFRADGGGDAPVEGGEVLQGEAVGSPQG